MAQSVRAVQVIWHGPKIFERFRLGAVAAVTEATKFISEEIKVNTSIPGKATGHPYATAHRGGSYNAPTAWAVHKPGDGLFVRIPYINEEADKVTGIAGLYSTLVSRAIVYGTSKMVPRSVVHKTLGQHRGEVRKILRKHLTGKGHK